ncbi:HIT family protein [Candidatus Woesearchaeota archaeon]|nr:HIT family protein [Candidatus Woesearchaeota archaeon]
MEEPDISKMSPEEVEELQRKNCVFCHIASGKVPAKKVYEDNECVAVLDINPANEGHMLLMPKEHYTVMLQVPEEILGHIFVIAKGLSQAGLKALQGKGTTIFAANGIAAGQRAPHFMLHIIPRKEGDNIGLYIPSRALAEKEAQQIAAALSAALEGKAIPAAAAESRSIAGEKGEKAAEAKPAKEEKPTAPPADKGKKEAAKEKENTDLDAITSLLTGKGK